MKWIRENRVDAVAGTAIAIGLGLLAWALIPMVIPDTDPATTSTPDPSLVSPYSSDEDESGPEQPDDSSEQSEASVPAQVQQGLGSFAGGGSGQGLAGGGGVANQPIRTVTLSLTSEAPLGTVGYIIPTSLRDNYGIRTDVGRTFSVTTTAYGPPDYAQGFARAAQRGFPVTCTITVDGRVTERQTTAGPYGALFCQG